MTCRLVSSSKHLLSLSFGCRHTISQRIANYLERRGLIQRDIENSYLNLPVDDEDSLLHLQGASVSYRVTIGPNQGQKVFTLQTVPQSTENEYGQLAKNSRILTSCRCICRYTSNGQTRKALPLY